MSTNIPKTHTSILCLALIARHYKIDISVDRLYHEYALGDKPPAFTQIQKIARDLGLKVRKTKLTWEDFAAAGDAFPIITPLNNGNYVIVVGFRPAESEKDQAQVAVFDPLTGSSEFLVMNREKFTSAWDGDAILFKRSYSLRDEKQPFGLRWFLPEILRQKRDFRDVIVAVLFIHAIALVIPLFFQLVIDKVLVHQAYSTLQVLGIGIVIALLFDGMLGFLRSYMLLQATSRIDIRVAKRTFSHLLALPIQFFEQATAGVLTKHMQQTASIREFLTGSLFLTVLDATALFVFVPVLFFYSVELTFVVLGFTALVAMIIGLLIPPFRRRLHALYQAEGDRQSLLVESIHGISTIKSLALEPTQRKSWEEKAARAVLMHLKVGKISITAQSFSQLLEKLMIVAVVWIGAHKVFEGTMTVGALVAFQMLATRVSGPMVQLVSLVHDYQETALSVRMLGTVMNQDTEQGAEFMGLRIPLRGSIEFEGVTFRYAPNLPPALENISLKIPVGKIIGVVGRSGSGKTTLTRLIQSIHKPQTGVLRIDNVDIREIDLPHLRGSIGVVLQENFLFRGTVRENIAMTKPNADFEEIVRVAHLAGASEFIERLPKSYDTEIEEGAANLSGGQKQRLAIARALLTDPRILILDEATSALDPESEAIVRKNLRHIAKGRTVIIVSHRLSMLTDVNATLVLEQGRVLCFAPHRELLANCPLYRSLWNQQSA